jgi:hypothetical protein
MAAGQRRPGHRGGVRRARHRRGRRPYQPPPAGRHGGAAVGRSAGGHGGRWLALLVRPHRPGQPATPRPGARGLARPGRLRAGPTQPPRHRARLPLAAQPRPGTPARGPSGPARPTRPATRTGQPGPSRGGGCGRPPLRPAGPGRRTGRPPTGRPPPRNRTLNRCAFKVYRYVAGGLLDDHDVTLAFTTVALSIGLEEAEVRRTLASARTAGLASPRGVPARTNRHQEHP